MKQNFTFLLVLFFTISSFSQTIDLTKYNDFLKKHVSKKGEVDYDKILDDIATLNDITRSFAKISPNAGWSKSELKSYWINFYNANILKLIAENYPIKSINYINEPFKTESIDFADGKISLDLIQHKILRKLDDPRVHFALFSTATSSPMLRNTAYDSQKIEYELGVAASNFVNDPTKNDINMRGSKLSKVFEWYKDDFDVKVFINKYSNTGKMNAETPITYLEYDWTIPRNR